MSFACRSGEDEDTGFGGYLGLVQCFGVLFPDLLATAFGSYLRLLYAAPRQRSVRCIPGVGRKPWRFWARW